MSNIISLTIHTNGIVTKELYTVDNQRTDEICTKIVKILINQQYSSIQLDIPPQYHKNIDDAFIKHIKHIKNEND